MELYVRGLWDAMNGIGTDEYTLTALVCTLPKNLYDEIHGLYEKTHQKKLVDHIEPWAKVNPELVKETCLEENKTVLAGGCVA